MTDFNAAWARLKRDDICYCEYCNKDTEHFPTMGLHLPACIECHALAHWLIHETEPVDRSAERHERAVKNALAEVTVLHSKEKP